MKYICYFLWLFPFCICFGAESERARWDNFYNSVKKDLRSEDLVVQLAAIEKFTGQDYEASAEFLFKLLDKGRDHPVILNKGADILGMYRSEYNIKMLKDAVDRKPENNKYLLNAYLRLGLDEAELVARNVLANSEEPQVKVVVIQWLMRNQTSDPSVIKMFIDCLDEKNNHMVRRAATEALGQLVNKEGIVPLISHIDDKIIGDDVRKALLRLTRKEFWDDIEKWKEWWKINGSTFEPKPISNEEFLPAYERLLLEKGRDESDIDFYERKITGKNILFLLDVSGSMEEDTLESSVPRIDRLKDELVDLIYSMEEVYHIGLLLFPHDTFPTRGLEKVDEAFQKKANRFIDKMRARGGTPMGEAFDYAFEKLVAKYNVDTIYILSDGEPSDIESEELLDKLSHYYEMYGVRINAISVGQESKLLMDIAKESGGDYWVVD